MNTIKNNKPLVVGVFISIGTLILIVTILAMGKQKNTFVKTFVISTIFNDVGGLLAGGNVWLSGVKVGTVKKVSFYGDSKVLVTMSIQEDAQLHIHKDAKAKIGSDGLIGSKIVIIYDGKVSTPQVEENDILQTETTLSTEDMLATLQANNKNVLNITNHFMHISKNIDSGNGVLTKLINDPEIANNIVNSSTDLSKALSNLKQITLEGKIAVSNFKTFSTYLTNKETSLNKIVKDTVIYQNLSNTIVQLMGSAYSINGFTTKLKTVSQKLNQKDNGVGVLLNDSSTAESIKNTILNLESGSHKLDQDLEALQHNFLLRRFFRKNKKAKALNKVALKKQDDLQNSKDSVRL